MEQKKVFISYSWEEGENDEWVKKLANSLEERSGIHVIWDRYDLDCTMDKNQYMEDSVFENDFMLVVATKKYTEKANSREGGVGIETYLNSAKHWGDIQSGTGAKSIVILRSESPPNYLKGQPYINFKDDAKFEGAFGKLLKEINGETTIERPKKQGSSLSFKSYKLTKAADLLSLKLSKRKVVISEADGTDYSGANRIKFEVWICEAFSKITVVLLHPNINMKQTLERVSREINEKNIDVEQLLVLSETSKRESLRSVLMMLGDAKYSTIHSKEYSYAEYIWSECIDDEFKVIKECVEVENYIEQRIKGQPDTETATEILLKALTKKGDKSFHLLLGGGGIGKSSLCDNVIHQLSKEDKIIPFLISSQEIRTYMEDNDYNPDYINSPYELFEIQLKVNRSFSSLDKKVFNLGLLSGNIVIIIDGLDEFPSIFGSKFNTKEFLKSLSDIHSELGHSRVLVTSREQKFLDELDEEDGNVNILELLGFNTFECTRYIRKRFKGCDEFEKVVATVKDKFESSSFYKGGVVVPFFAEVICDMYDDASDVCDGFFESENTSLPFKCLGEITDEIIFSIFEREKGRHKYPISAKEMFELFCDFTARYGRKWNLDVISDDLKMMYDEDDKYSLILNSILINPLITRKSDDIQLKYDFTLEYFNYIYIVDVIENGRIEAEAFQLLAKTNIQSSAFSDVKSYYNDSEDFLSKALRLVGKGGAGELCKRENASYYAACELLFYLYYRLNKTVSMEGFTKLFNDFYNLGELNNINGSYVKGEFPPLDFSNMVISNSRFRNYPNFLKSKFSNSSFMYTKFIECDNSLVKTSGVGEADIDSDSCEMGDLKEAIERFDSVDSVNSELIIDECKKFIGSFTNGQTYKDKKKDYIRFSTKVDMLSKKSFSKIIKKGYIAVGNIKESETYYEISQNYRDSFRKFYSASSVRNNAQIQEFLSFISRN
jgi:hypothetical protein